MSANLSPKETSILDNSSAEGILYYASGVQEHLKHSRWLDAGNMFLDDVVEEIQDDPNLEG